ncbi:MAG TPA: hypothetical protein VGN42_04905, partial [Pirellulales bacterium]|nr:hypothetical protein [Pirellulales bacterium]
GAKYSNSKDSCAHSLNLSASLKSIRGAMGLRRLGEERHALISDRANRIPARQKRVEPERAAGVGNG